LVALCAVDESGTQLFGVREALAIDQAPGLGPLLDRIYEVAQRVNRMRKEDAKSAEKNSGHGRNGETGSDSPGTSA
jgi:hypothetical protein